jgi:hypothetical protein
MSATQPCGDVDLSGKGVPRRTLVVFMKGGSVEVGHAQPSPGEKATSSAPNAMPGSPIVPNERFPNVVRWNLIVSRSTPGMSSRHTVIDPESS